MTTDTIKLKGFKVARPAPSVLRSPRVTVKAELRPGAFRSGSESAAAEAIRDDDVLEVEFADGLRLWVTGAEYRARTQPLAARGAGGAPDEYELAAQWAVPGVPAERGLAGMVIKSLKLLGIDLAGESARAIGKRFEDGTPGDAKRPGPGFYRCRPATGAFRLEPAGGESVPLDKPVLVLIHGTASSAWGSFGDLWSPQRRDTLDKLRARYGDNVFALEHRTFTESAIDNALALATILPAGAGVDLLSHSRGGLVGELLARANVSEGSEPFDANEIALAGRIRDLDRRALAPGERKEIETSLVQAQTQLKKLGETLRERKLRVERFVRVACPALGTTLVSGRLDRWLSIVGNVGSFALSGTPVAEIVDALGEFIAAVIKSRTDPSTLPGLACMMPDCGLVHVLNNGRCTIDSRLAVVAGDIEPDGIWQRLYTLALDRFYDGQHDLVVNTGSMYGGAARTRDNALLSFHSGSAVNHFTYFANAESAEAIARALATPLDQPLRDFEPLRPAVKPIARGVQTRASGAPASYVYVLPGIMGSELSVGDEKIWASIPKLMAGGLGRLAIDASGVVATAPHAPSYGELIEALAGDRKVIPFPFDWRLSPEQEADRLADDVRRTLADANRERKPVSFLAHSMGGLIVRTMIARHPDVWQEVKGHPQARLVMLGTPNGGSYSIVELLVGKAETLDYLSLLDFEHSPGGLLKIIVRFPGVLAMLPRDEDLKWFDHETWELFRKGEGGNWPLPAAQDLERARAFRALLDASPFEPGRMIYVAGQAPATIDRAAVGTFKDFGRSFVDFEATNAGDGRVPWASGIPPDVPTWYLPAAHGDMAAVPEHFAAITDLLDRGTSTRLQQSPPVPAEATKRIAFSRGAEPSLPDERALTAAALGAGTKRTGRRRKGGQAIQVTLLHADLAFASHPVIVGHYVGDTIVSAEAALDEALGGQLREEHRAGIYPGPIETSETFTERVRDGSGRRRGAIVVGLGAAGEIAVEPLRRTLARALLQYAVRVARQAREDGSLAPGAGVQELGLTSLLIGTHAGGVRVIDSVMALLEAFEQANQALDTAKVPVRLAKLELIELWEDRALQAAEALGQLGERSHLRGTFAFDGKLTSGSGGRRRTRFAEPPGWWQRLQIKGAPPEGEKPDGTLRFLTLTRRARAESRTAATQLKLVDELVRNAIGDSRDDPALRATLFELLLPNELKDEAPERDNLVIVVDAEAARYPWELLEDRTDRLGRPLAVGRGFLRQLETATFRQMVRGATEDLALVVGDPILPENSGLPQLDGAREEATLVATRLRRSGFDAKPLINPSANEIISALFQRPYRILHLAGHGVYDYREPGKPADSKRVSGMVIGDGIYLTPSEVEQMRVVPELVFINCCHLGYIEGPDGKPKARADWNALAANLAAQFMRMGVRAVVAAGWAVNDMAAKTFADTFYDSLLAGATFGEAVKDARGKTWENHRYSNTWGAYQCYGDPDYRLRIVDAQRREARETMFASVAEALNEIENVRRDLSVRAAKPAGPFLERLRQVRNAIVKQGWARNPRLLVALARAYGEAHEFEEAATCCYEALERDDSALEIKDLEQLSNFESRGALARWRSRPSGDNDPTPCIERIDRALTRLKWLDARDTESTDTDDEGHRFARSDTVERLNLIAGAYKRRAWIDAATRGESLRSMYEHYDRAFRLARRRGSSTAYPLLNRLQAALVRAWNGDAQAPRIASGEVEAMRQAKQALEASRQGGLTFWDAVSLADHALTEALIAGKLQPETVRQLAERYREAQRLGSPREFASVLDQIDFFADMAQNETIRDPLTELSAQLSGPADDPHTRGAPPPRPGAGGVPRESGPPTSGAPPEPGAGDRDGGGPAVTEPASPSPAGSEAAGVSDVRLGAAAPASARPGAQFVASFAAYPADDETELKVKELLETQAPGSTVVLGKRTCRWADGTLVEVRLRGEHLAVEYPEQSFTWSGKIETLDFAVTVDARAPTGQTLLKFDVLVTGARVAGIVLPLEIAPGAQPGKQASATADTPRTAFASYSSRDRPTVANMLGAIERSAGIQVFQDCLDLKAGEQWKAQLAEEIRGRDLFMLFWSQPAAESKWVKWEWQTALREKGKDAMQIHPLQPDTKPPAALRDLHFGSKWAIVADYYSRPKPRGKGKQTR